MRDLYLPRLHEWKSSLPRVISFASSIPAAPLDEACLMVVGRRSQFASTPSDRFFSLLFFRILPRGRRLPNCFSGFCANIVKHKQHTTPGRVEAGRHRTGTTRVGSIMITNHRRVSGPALYRGGHYGKCDNWNVNHRKSGNEYNNKDGR